MSKGDQQRSARERLAEERERDSARGRRNRAMLVTGGGVAAVAVVVGVSVAMASRGDRQSTDLIGYTGAVAPVTRQADGSTVMAMPGVTRPVLEIFEDFQCPACRMFEATNGANAKRLAAEGKVRIVYRPFRLFTQDPLKSNSQRAANAALCAPAADWMRYHDTLYRHQPAEGSSGFGDKELIRLAAAVGITGKPFADCVDNRQKRGEVQKMTAYATGPQKVQSTPTGRLDGRQLNQTQMFTSAGFVKAITAAAAKTGAAAVRSTH
jgi:protein-disulfide isomerase